MARPPQRHAKASEAIVKQGGAGRSDASTTPASVSTPADHETPRAVVVGLGASAGGLEALQVFFDSLPNHTGAAYVVVQHLSPDFKSLMDEILRRHTEMPVVRVDDRAPLLPDHVYLLPPSTNIIVDGEELRVEAQGPNRTIPRPIDVFFESLANQRAGANIAIILSGTGSDGSRGIQSVKASGGIVMVQSPESSAFDGMPYAALSTGVADFSLEPSQLAEKVVSLLAHPFLRAGPGLGQQSTDIGPYESILRLLKDTTEYDLSSYKSATIVRRIERRMSLRSLSDVNTYVEVLQRDPDEVTALARDCFIHVTRFFRDLQAFWAFRQRLMALIVQFHERAEPLRIWVAGCSTGEEAYSIAALLDRCLREMGAKFDFKMFATDIVESTLSTASAGRYPMYVESDIPRNYFKTLVMHDEDGLRVLPVIRNRIVFARHDVLRDPPFPRADVVVCRNLLIYLQPDAQRAALERFHFALRRGGILFLGPSETIDTMQTDFHVLDTKWKLFSKKTDSRIPTGTLGFPRFAATRNPPQRAAAKAVVEHPMLRVAERLIELFAEAGVVVSESGEVIYTFGDAGRWLRMPKGPVTTDLRDMLPEGIAPALLVGLRRARASAEVIHVARMPRSDTSDKELISIDLVHLPSEGSLPGLDIVLVGNASVRVVREGPQLVDVDEAVNSHVTMLERELQSTRESLQTSIEELETTNEELQSVNEELLASNEELQSTNQELHSVNEELYSVNAEHQDKIAELAQVTEDLQNLLRTTAIGTLFLDSELRVRRFTPSVEIVIPLRDQDLGRPIYDLASHLDGVDLAQVARQVLESDSVLETHAKTKNLAAVLVRGHPLTLPTGERGGVVLTFVDLSNVNRAFNIEDVDRRTLESALQSFGDVIWIADSLNHAYNYLSPSFEAIWGRQRSTLLRNPDAWFDTIHPDDCERVERELAARGDGRPSEIEYRVVRPDGEVRTVRDRCFGKSMSDLSAATSFGVIEDITAARAVDRQRRRTGEIHRIAGEQARVPMMFVSPDGAVLWSNRSARRALEWLDTPAPATIQEVLASAEDNQTWTEITESVARSSSPEASTLIRLKTRAGKILPCDLEIAYSTDGATGTGLIVCQWTDISSQLAREQELASKVEVFAEEANHDPLTGLHNRRGLERLLRQQYQISKRSFDPMMALLVDCDNFKHINDGYGHSAGDVVLKEVAQRLRSSLRPSDLLARVGGDEFLAVLPASRLAEGAHVGEKLRRAVAAGPITYQEQPLKATISVGVVAAPVAESTVDDLVKAASGVLKQSKVAGRDRVSYSDGGEFSGVLSAMDSALERLLAGQIRVVAQEINDVRTGAVVGFELLCRGPDPMVSPSVFFEAARRADCLEEVDLACLGRCIGRALEINSGREFHLNVFPTSLLDSHGKRFENLVSRVKDRSKFCIELSEQQFVGGSALVRSRMDDLREMGFRIALDDIGFGHSALETLLAVEPDVVKIDRAMTAQIDQDVGARRTLQRLVSLFSSPATELIAEGIERESQREILVDLGVQRAQGFLWSHPDKAN